VDKYGTSTDKTMTRVAADGARRRNDWKLNADERWRSGMLMHKKGLGPLLVEEGTGRRPRVVGKVGVSSESGHPMMMGIISGWANETEWTTLIHNECKKYEDKSFRLIGLFVPCHWNYNLVLCIMKLRH
jgi:hypothetical protein